MRDGVMRAAPLLRASSAPGTQQDGPWAGEDVGGWEMRQVRAAQAKGTWVGVEKSGVVLAQSGSSSVISAICGPKSQFHFDSKVFLFHFESQQQGKPQ